MSKPRHFYTRLLPLADLALVLLCIYYSPLIVNTIAAPLGWEVNPSYRILQIAPFLAGAAAVLAPFVLNSTGFYRKQGLQRVSSAVRQIFTFGIYYLCALGLYQTVYRLTDFSNQVILVNLILVPILIFLRYYLYRAWRLRNAAGTGSLTQVLVVGQEDAMKKGWAELPDYWRRSMHIVGRVPPSTTREELQALITQNHVTQALLFGGISAYNANFDALLACELQGIDIYIHLHEDQPINLRAAISEIGDQRMLILSSAPEYSWARFLKAVLDRILGLVILLCSLPAWLVAAIGIKLSDPSGPIFYKQMRSGLYGKPFAMWKFRSMYTDAEQRLDEIKAQYGNEMNGPIFKLTNDPRIFPFGHIIRKLSIDELPQLLNVIKGEMSIVGPRPLPVYETAAFPEIAHRRRLSVRPGLTCYWQIEDRSDNGDFEVMVRKDLKYIDNWSLWLDITLFFRTIPAVLFGKGAK